MLRSWKKFMQQFSADAAIRGCNLRPPRRLVKSFHMLALLPQRPGEFLDRALAGWDLRLQAYLRRKPDYATEVYDKALSRLGKLLKVDLNEIMAEHGLVEIESTVRSGLAGMPSQAPFPSFHNGDFRMARLCYALVRALCPDSIVETGVCYGVTSAFMLKALEENGAGILHSIDLPPLARNSGEFVGWLVPRELRFRWRLSLGSAKRLLPEVVADLGRVDLFLHDSLHTYRNISGELTTIAPYLAKQSLVIADDIEGNSAFHDWVVQRSPSYWAAITEEAKNSLLGVAAFVGEE
jgi:Methyltransferase domain